MLKWERGYLAALAGETGAAVEERRQQHESQIRWFQHQITNLKEPVARVSALTIAVNTAEKKLTAAGKECDEARAVYQEAETKLKQS